MSEDLVEDLSKLFSHGQQMWLLGAGASFQSNLPLVRGLTERVRHQLATAQLPNSDRAEITIGHVIEGLRADIGPTATVEDILDHLADHLSMARRSASKSVSVRLLAPGEQQEQELNSEQCSYDELESVRTAVLRVMRDTLRWGYVHADEPTQIQVGSQEKPILTIDHHERFVDVLFSELRAGRQLRVQPIEFFTTNYDTLIEDALALKGIAYADGFRGGAIAYWNMPAAESLAEQREIRATVTKIHGSIDWARTGDRVIRRRISDPYPQGDSELLIYPQAQKYDLTQREPFDSLFYRFRTSLSRPLPQVVLICGYGFGDDHVDEEIELALKRSDSQLTLVAFKQRRDGKPAQWQEKDFGERVYTITADGIWRGTEGPFLAPANGQSRDWWTFTGMTSFIRNPESTI